MGLQVLSVLDAAHRAGIIHRDIKPANLVITRDRRVKVTDFGVARVQGSSLAHTQAGMILGTPRYAAPEQLLGRAIDARADLYALGAVLYEAVTGRAPFEAPSLYELMALVQTASPEPASSVAPGVPTTFDAFLDRALARSPDLRFASAREMAKALQGFLTAGSTETAADSSRSRAQTLVQVPTVAATGEGVHELVAGVVRGWPGKPLGPQDVSQLLERLLEKPLHAAAFCGAVEVSGTLLLICDGVLYDAFDASSGLRGDLALGELPGTSDATLLMCPPGMDARVIGLLASLLAPTAPRLSGLDAGFVDVSQLASKLAREGFDGAIRFLNGARLGFALFSRGVRILDVFGPGWPQDPASSRWEAWIATAGALVSVEDRRTDFPSQTFRRQLRGHVLEVVRPRPDLRDSIRSDTRALGESLSFRARARTVEGPSESTMQALVEADPAVGAARWLLADVPHQFEQYRRTSRWRAMLEPIGAIETVTLHHEESLGEGRTAHFDVVTRTANGGAVHVLERAAAGTPQAVSSFIERAVAVREIGGAFAELTGAVLVAPSFSEAALESYMTTLSGSRRASLRVALDLLTHREGFLYTSRGGVHVLLVEEIDGRRRPLVPEL